MPSEVIELSGHIIDSWTLPRAWDVIMDRGGNFVVADVCDLGRSFGRVQQDSRRQQCG